ncbi:alpha/beta hydrolase-fold protein [Paenibacillus aurantius]|uniref:Alpha/beta hydrolase-fold protein n=1 Tax=Paenibacillus aurantius TaxID=2918900 RepID=A0AA96LC40_9BACL|nr:alpha/beta fold hydrolase [Paenibacillus aurantius]WNQ09530.1 alpha/beta hydrolase-fold protein [Paenibacillus aurantius]
MKEEAFSGRACFGRTETHELHSFGEDPVPVSFRYKVYLPEGYDAGRENGYPVLYLLHGSGGDETSWDNFLPFLNGRTGSGSPEAMIAVAPSGGNSFWIDSPKYGPYETAVIHRLVPEIDRRYNTVPGREGRFLAGVSMGGYGALRYALTYPGMFGGAVLLSPAVQAEEPPATSRAVTGGAFGEPFDRKAWDRLNYPAALASYAAQPWQVPIFILAGDEDWNHLSEKEDLPEDAWRYNMEVQAVRLYFELHRKNLYNRFYPKGGEVPASPAELRIVKGGHTESVWLPGFVEGVSYLLRYYRE